MKERCYEADEGSLKGVCSIDNEGQEGDGCSEWRRYMRSNNNMGNLILTTS